MGDLISIKCKHHYFHAYELPHAVLTVLDNEKDVGVSKSKYYVTVSEYKYGGTFDVLFADTEKLHINVHSGSIESINRIKIMFSEI